MPPVPGYDDVKATGDMTTAELNWLVFAIYFSALCFVLQLALACHHIWLFLIKQEKYKTTPLLMFYILIVMLSVTRILNNIYILWEKSH